MAGTAAQSRDRFRKIANRARAIPGLKGLRPHTVALLLNFSESNAAGGITDFSDKVVPIVEGNGQAPKVVWEKAEDVPDNNSTPSDTIIVGPITPLFAGGGTDLNALIGSLEDGDQRYLLITGPKHPNGAKYQILDVRADKALHYMIRAQAVSASMHGFGPPI